MDIDIVTTYWHSYGCVSMHIYYFEASEVESAPKTNTICILAIVTCNLR